MKNLGAAVCLAALGVVVWAQTPYATEAAPAVVREEAGANRGAAAVWQSLKKLRTRASLLMITAHPDDEDGGMLTEESRGRGARVGLLTLNRGEGGANVMSPDFFDALGLVRTQELLEAGRRYGVEQYWTSLIDYGFSKTMAESLGKWGHERALGEVVRVVRMTRPLVITSVFVGGPSDGHGNHQTAGALAREVFAAAGDPKRFPEQIRAGLHPWTPLKGYARVPFRRAEGVTAQVEVATGEYDPLLGETYGQLARVGLGFQKSQNGGPAVPAAGAASSRYHRYESKVAAQEREGSFYDGIDVSLSGIAALAGSEAAFLKSGLAAMEQAVERATAAFSATAPERCVPALAEGLRATERLEEAVRRSGLSEQARYDVGHELAVKRVQFQNAIALALGLRVYATVAPAVEPSGMAAFFGGDAETMTTAIPGQTFAVKVRVVQPGSADVRVRRVSVEAADGRDWHVTGGGAAGALAANQPWEGRFSVTVPVEAASTRPYFSRPDLEQPYYDVADERWRGRSTAPDPLATWAEVEVAGAVVRVGAVVQSVRKVTGLGTVYEPLAVAPAIGVTLSQRAGIVPLAAESFRLEARVHSNAKGPADGTVRLELPAGWRAEPATAAFHTKTDGEDAAAAFTVTPAKVEARRYRITAVAESGGRSYREGYETAGYAGLRPSYLYRPATYDVTGVNVKMAPGLKVGYIMGSGDEVPQALEALGVRVVSLSAADLAAGDLRGFDVIVMGIRAYAAREELKTHNQRLLDYVRDGGVLMVQYNTPEYDQNYGPYPYVMGANPEEVTDEESVVKILKPEHAVFQWPNRITVADFQGWVEERGSKWLQSWDPRYEALLETQDEGQAPQRGGLLVARYGKGLYLYNAWAFYRQLPEGVPGAYRLFANLLSLAKNPQAR